MRKMFAIAIVGIAAAAAAPAEAGVLSGSYQVTVSEGVTNGAGFNTANGNPFSGANTASASFLYTGLLNFLNNAPQAGVGGDLNSSFGFSTANISGYTGSGTVLYNGTQVANFGSLASFLSSSASAAGQLYGSFFTFNLGNFNAGDKLIITHDDGAAVFQNGTRIGSTVSGPTGQVTDTVTLTNTGPITLAYSRQNGTPSILSVAAVPEPATWALMILGMGAVGFAMRRRKNANTNVVVRFA
jgi:hypothetical protein